ncbi:MAG: 50S ribosomal protein L11 methyltransferase, partial [Verrucomicrobiota bacterium]
RRFEIVPAWEWEEREGIETDRIRIVMNPGLSFGTGEHFTTRFCLESLETLVVEGATPTMLDLGTGSGILAIAAVKLGCVEALGVDNDATALERARENAEANGVASTVRLDVADLTLGEVSGTYDLVCANLFDAMLIEHAVAIYALTRHHLVVTGIREIQLDAVAETYRMLGAREWTRDGDGEWGGLILEKPVKDD